MRTILLVPRMFTKIELGAILGVIPEDYEEKNRMYWSYVGEKMSKFTKKVKKVYYGSLYLGGEDGLRFLERGDQPGYELVKELVEDGAELQATEDRVLVEETMSWLRIVEDEPSESVQRMIKENMRERDRYVARVIDKSLSNGEVGVILLEPHRNLKLSPDIRVVKIYPFNPTDYLKAWQIKVKTR